MIQQMFKTRSGMVFLCALLGLTVVLAGCDSNKPAEAPEKQTPTAPVEENAPEGQTEPGMEPEPAAETGTQETPDGGPVIPDPNE